MTGVQLIAAERRRQIRKEGWTPEHDDQHRHSELARAASVYARPEVCREYFEDGAPQGWPAAWGILWWKPCPNDRIRELVKAGALIAAEIDRLQRSALPAGTGGEG